MLLFKVVFHHLHKISFDRKQLPPQQTHFLLFPSTELRDIPELPPQVAVTIRLKCGQWNGNRSDTHHSQSWPIETRHRQSSTIFLLHQLNANKHHALGNQLQNTEEHQGEQRLGHWITKLGNDTPTLGFIQVENNPPLYLSHDICLGLFVTATSMTFTSTPFNIWQLWRHELRHND